MAAAPAEAPDAPALAQVSPMPPIRVASPSPGYDGGMERPAAGVALPTPEPIPGADTADAGTTPAIDETVRQRQAARVEHELRVAMRRVPVTMYSTAWCPVCAKARTWLHQNDVSFTDLDVEKDDRARRVQRSLNPAGGVPTIDVDGVILIGFDPTAMRAALGRGAERRARQF